MINIYRDINIQLQFKLNLKINYSFILFHYIKYYNPVILVSLDKNQIPINK